MFVIKFDCKKTQDYYQLILYTPYILCMT